MVSLKFDQGKLKFTHVVCYKFCIYHVYVLVKWSNDHLKDQDIKAKSPNHLKDQDINEKSHNHLKDQDINAQNYMNALGSKSLK